MSIPMSDFDYFIEQLTAAMPSAEIIRAGSKEAPTKTEWLEVVPFFNGTTNYAVGSLGVERGVFRVIVTSKSLVTHIAEDLANQIIAAFPKGSKFGSAVTDEMPSKSGLIQEADRVKIPVDIRWRATRT